MASKSLGLEFAKQPASSFRPTKAERERMKQCGIIVVYEENGLIKMDGACSDETGAFGGGRLYLQLPKREDHGFQGGEFVSGNRDKNTVTIDARKNIAVSYTHLLFDGEIISGFQAISLETKNSVQNGDN